MNKVSPAGLPGEGASHSPEIKRRVTSGSGVTEVDGEEFRLEAGVRVAVSPGGRHEITKAGGDLVLCYFGVEA